MTKKSCLSPRIIFPRLPAAPVFPCFRTQGSPRTWRRHPRLDEAASIGTWKARLLAESPKNRHVSRKCQYKNIFRFCKKLYRIRFMLGAMALRELKATYVGSFFGFFWAVLNPLCQIAIYGVIFGFFLKGSRANGIRHKELFSLPGDRAHTVAVFRADAGPSSNVLLVYRQPRQKGGRFSVRGAAHRDGHKQCRKPVGEHRPPFRHRHRLHPQRFSLHVARARVSLFHHRHLRGPRLDTLVAHGLPARHTPGNRPGADGPVLFYTYLLPAFHRPAEDTASS